MAWIQSGLKFKTQRLFCKISLSLPTILPLACLKIVKMLRHLVAVVKLTARWRLHLNNIGHGARFLERYAAVIGLQILTGAITPASWPLVPVQGCIVPVTLEDLSFCYARGQGFNSLNDPRKSTNEPCQRPSCGVVIIDIYNLKTVNSGR